MHIAQGLMNILSVNKLISAGCKVKIWIGDWFARLNGVMDGDLGKIQTAGRYVIEVWKAAGMNLQGGQVELVWSSEEINTQSNEYWLLVMDIAIKNTLAGYSEKQKDELKADQILNPFMQCAEILFPKVDICQLGMDQRELNDLAMKYCDDTNRENKPIILSHHVLPGLKEGQVIMSKTDQSSAIFMDDDENKVIKKIKSAYCPPKVVDKNPCIQYLKYIVFPWLGELNVQREADHGGDKTYISFEELVVDFEKGDLHPADLKRALSKALNMILKPVRNHFENDENAKALLKTVKALKQKEAVKSQKSLKQKEAVRSQKSEEELSSSSPTTQMNAAERFMIVRSVGETCIQDEELKILLSEKPQPICYDGFEPSGRMHIAQGIMKTLSVNKLTSAGCKVKIWIADWFALLNDKMGGDLEKIQTLGRYFIEIWKAAGMNLEGHQVEFLWSSEEINSSPREYWPLVMDIAKRNTLRRIIRCCQIMGRKEEDKLSAAQIFYPCMQCADIFFLKVGICQLGEDQRKVNMLAREYCKLTKKEAKPIILSHHMLPGLKEGQAKMSKSDLSSAIFMDDDEDKVIEKIKSAYCPEKVVDKNPCVEYIKYIVFPWFGNFTVQQQGGEKSFTSFEDLVIDYEKGDVNPDDLKHSLSKALNIILKPVRDHFANDEDAKALLKTVKGFTIPNKKTES
ncbi:hypothetical protein QVD17_22565 [Tagetes erecta]|uniref:tyrosine--tRNA ligase n=1 Tax=Tagetes erecta TaxID=13708 RepID=A0AAD8NLS8_TARER|nr:hypothetical protein QVD17_22565 [Tagetes erecta]